MLFILLILRNYLQNGIIRYKEVITELIVKEDLKMLDLTNIYTTDVLAMIKDSKCKFMTWIMRVYKKI